MNPSSRRTRVLRRLAPLPLLLAVLLALAGCSGGLGDSDDAGTTEPMADAPAAEEGADADDGAARDAVDTSGTEVQEQALIRTGEIDLVADDVERARGQVESLVTRYGGEIADERTETDDDGWMTRTRLVLRVPSDDFAEAFLEVSELAELRSASSTTEDVTTQVIDTRVRVRAQEKSLRRVEQLLARARSLRDIVAIEAELTRRQAELDSLKAQQSYLADQTTMGTLTVRIDEKPRQATTAAADEKGFVAGLSGGWGALKSVTVVLATVTGALLPFAAVLAALAVPVLLLLRLRRTRRPVIPT